MIFQHAIDKAHLYANKKGCTTLGASRKFKAESHDILQRELKVAERETTLTVVAAMESVKTALLKGSFASLHKHVKIFALTCVLYIKPTTYK